MALLTIEVPHDVSRTLRSVVVPGEKQERGTYHITMVYLGDNVPITTLMEATEVIFDVVQKSRPFPVYTSVVTTFSPGSHGVPVICQINSTELVDLQRRIVKAFDAKKIAYDKKFPDYKPHVTLSYASEAEAESIDYQVIPTISWGCHELTLWGGEEADDRLVVKIPLPLRTARKVAARHMLRNLTNAFGRFG